MNDPNHRVANSKAAYTLWANPQTGPDDMTKKEAILWKPVMRTALVWMTTWSLAVATGNSASLTETQAFDTIKKAIPWSIEDRDWDWDKFRVP